MVYLFHRLNHHEKFIYYGIVKLKDLKINENIPNKFKFQLIEYNTNQKRIYEEEAEYIIATDCYDLQNEDILVDNSLCDPRKSESTKMISI